MVYSNPLDRDFGRRELIKFSFPTIIMMLAISTYSILDVALLSRLVSLDSMAAANIAFPVSSFMMGIGIMLGRGGSSLIAKKMGQKKEDEACHDFTFLVIVGVALGILFAVAGVLGAEKIALFLGANETLIRDTSIYLRVLMLFAPFTLLQLMFQSLYITAGKGKLGMSLMIISGITDAVLNVVFMGVLDMGILGAALSTVIGHSISPLVGVYIFSKRKNGLRFLKPSFDMRFLGKSCSNGTSELVTNLAGGVTTFLFNSAMMMYYREAGVSAITIITYTQFFLSSIYIGFSSGVAAIFSFNLGAENHERIRSFFKECIQIIAILSLVITVISFICSGMIVTIFANTSEEVYDPALNGMRFLALSFLFTGVNTFASSFFAAMSKGRTSTIISFLRKLIFPVVGIVLFKIIFKENGVWMTILIAEVLTGILAGSMLWKMYRKEIVNKAESEA